MPFLKTEELKTLGYWDRFLAISKHDPKVEQATMHDIPESVMAMLRGDKLLPEWCRDGGEKAMPTLAYAKENHTVIEQSNGSYRPIASVVAQSFGELLADAPRMLEALRLLSKESLGDMAYDVRERTIGDGWAGDSWKHPRVTAWGKACELTAELVKKHESFGK